MLRRYAWFGLLIAAALLIRGVLVVNKHPVEHDEAISYLAATGHMGDYARMLESGWFPYNQWAAARTWRQFVEPEDWLVFGRIARDLAQYDVHPPLYFWLLHIWSLIVGVAPWTGALLNWLIDGVTGAALYRLARRSFNRDQALAVVALWALSPVALLTMRAARAYSLFTLLAALYALAVQEIKESETQISADDTDSKKRFYFFMILTGAAGLLTHYYFVLVLAAGGTIVLMQRDRARLVEFGVCTVLGGVLFAALHPHFIESFGGREEFRWAVLSTRLSATGEALLLLLIPVVVAFILPLVWMTIRRGKARGSAVERGPNEVFLLWLLGGQIVLYLLQISPEHALMDYRYFGPAWPFAALAMVRVLNTPDLARLACVGMLLLAGIIVWPGDKRPYAQPESGTRILIDNPARGVLLPVVMQLDGDTLVFAADQADLLVEPERWLSALRRDGGLYSYLPLYDATDSGHAAILNLIAAAAEIKAAPELYRWQADFHRDQEQVVWIVKE